MLNHMRIGPFTQSAGLPRSLPSHTSPLKFADGNTSGTLSISSHGLEVGYDDGEQCQRSSCSVRLEGPVILVGFRGTSKGCLRPQWPILVPTERCPPAGEYRIWLACSHARIGAKGAGRSLIDTGALVGAFSEREQVDGSPFVVSIPDRWCEGISSLSGVPHPWAELAPIQSGWWKREIKPGTASLEWHADAYRWQTFAAGSVDFWGRKAFQQAVPLDVCQQHHDGEHDTSARRVKAHGTQQTILFVGDSLVRGIFCDLDNWWRRKLNPAQLPLYTFDGLNRSSSWDGKVCGFNPPPNAADISPEDLRATQDLEPAWRQLVLRDQWNPPRIYVSNRQLLRLVYVETTGMQLTVAALRALRDSEFRVQGAQVHAIYLASCHWDIGRYKKPQPVLRELWLNASRELATYGGEVVVGTCTAKHGPGDLDVMLGGVYKGVEDAIRLAAPMGWRRLDLFSSSVGRPDRSQDSFHFSWRKCGISPQHKTCPLGQRDVTGCCLRPDSFAQPVSPTWAAMLLNTLCPHPVRQPAPTVGPASATASASAPRGRLVGGRSVARR